ncbi:hypothetical protein NQ314_001302 [Rhamnusium bicolor]|uniref:Uncharacterized protein n=1 Tax=Rhamnusium bicolor TaxID=1586634 RepID=A0AAV8ZS82_9CUCU|nr:hypothetical protein NQ314_001302 [Rhamnusium bicolor]
MDPETLTALVLIEDEYDDILRLLLSTREEAHELYRSRSQEGYYRILIKTHLAADDEKFRCFLRLNRDQFDSVLNLIHVHLKKQSTNSVKIPITPKEKLALTLR